MKVRALKPVQLYRPCDRSALRFRTTDEVTSLDGALGQERAVEAIRFGSSTEAEGFNLFLYGPPGTGKYNIVHHFLSEKAAKEITPDDWVYINNFDDSHKPIAMPLPPGRGLELKQAVHQTIDDIRAAVTTVFESEDYRNRHNMLEETYRQDQQHAFDSLSEKAATKNVALVMTPRGFALAPARDGQVIDPEELAKLEDPERERWQADIKELEKELEAIIASIPRRTKELREKLQEMNREISAYVVDAHMADLLTGFSGLPQVAVFVDAMRADLIDNIRTVLGMNGDGGTEEAQHPTNMSRNGGAALGFGRYEVNIIVTNSPDSGAPVIYEDHPSLGNLIGRIEHIEHMGALLTDFRMIKPGAFHRALGGYLLLDARQVLIQPFAWEALKRTIRSGCIKTESPGKYLTVISTVSLEPAPVPHGVKVVLLGDPMMYYLLSAYDPEFSELFKVGADFDNRMERSPETEKRFSECIAMLAKKHEMRAFEKSAVGRIIEYSARETGDSERLSLELAKIKDLMHEADWIAGEDRSKYVKRSHVEQALNAARSRRDRIRERSQEAIQRGDILIDTIGSKIGQINALSVLQIGGYSFGRPTRITARTWMGKGRVIDIEREVELGGPLHSKGVMILSSYLSSQFVPGIPLALAASLVFEQTYGGVDGDSASSTELYALLSSLSEIPIKQSLAVTGSVNQHGLVQAIGGVNEKIEGFFDICRERGLTGEQGVLIPVSNVKHLMLRSDVVEATRKGNFRIFPVETIAQGIELLTGLRSGVRGANGKFKNGTIFAAVENRLSEFAASLRRFGKGGGGNEEEKP